MPQVIMNDPRLDTAENLWFSRQLEHIKAGSYDVLYAANVAARVIPVSNEANPGATTITYRQYDAVGFAKIVANYAKDIPRVDLLAQEFTTKVKSIADSYGFSIQDIRAARMAGVNLEDKGAAAALQAIVQLENQLAFFGDTGYGIQGFFTNPNIPTALAPADGVGATSTFSTKTPNQIIRDISNLISGIRTRTQNVEKPNTVLLPLSTWTYLNQTPRSDLGDRTIMGWLKENNALIDGIQEWIPLNELETAGVSGTRMMVAYDRNPRKLTLEIPQPFEMFPPQYEGLEWHVPCHERIGGTIVYYPLSAAFLYGI